MKTLTLLALTLGTLGLSSACIAEEQRAPAPAAASAASTAT